MVVEYLFKYFVSIYVLYFILHLYPFISNTINYCIGIYKMSRRLITFLNFYFVNGKLRKTFRFEKFKQISEFHKKGHKNCLRHHSSHKFYSFCV